MARWPYLSTSLLDSACFQSWRLSSFCVLSSFLCSNKSLGAFFCISSFGHKEIFILFLQILVSVRSFLVAFVFHMACSFHQPAILDNFVALSWGPWLACTTSPLHSLSFPLWKTLYLYLDGANIFFDFFAWLLQGKWATLVYKSFGSNSLGLVDLVVGLMD